MANTKVTSNVLADDAVTIGKIHSQAADGNGGFTNQDPSDGHALVAKADTAGYYLSWESVGVAGISSSADATAITIDSSERVAIGSSTANKIFNIADPNQGGETLKLHFEAFSSDDKWAIYSYDRTNGHVADLSFGSNYMYLKSGGNVGIGTTSPDAELHIEPVSSNASIVLSNDGRTQYYRIQNNESADALTFNLSDASEKLRIQSGGGISFNGDTATANALDDYEEGTWTPTYSSDVGLGTVDGITGASGEYVKIGQYVHLFGKFTLNGSSGTRIEKGDCVRLTGLPFVLNDRKSSGTVYTTRAFTNKGGFTGAAYWYASSYAVIQFLGQGSTVWSGDENETVYFSINFRKSS